MGRALQFERPAGPKPGEDLGPCIGPEEASMMFPLIGGKRPTPDWCVRNIRPRVKCGRLIFFYEQDVKQFIFSRREAESA